MTTYLLRTSPHLQTSLRHYISRAHQVTTPTHPIKTAIPQILEGAAERRKKREAKWIKYAPTRERARQNGSTYFPPDDPVFRNQDETVDIVLNMNLDPRKPGQNLRGSFALPYGTGKEVKLAVFTDVEEDESVALESGAYLAGGEELIKKIKDGEVAVDFDRAMATKNLMPKLSREVARILGPRGLMPSPKLGTVVTEEEDIGERVRAQLVGLVNYRTDKEGIIHAPVGKASFGYEKLMENLKAFLEGIMDAKPDVEGKKLGKKGRKKKKGEGKFMLKAHIGCTQGKSWKLDIKTVDPASPFFMKDVVE